MTTSYRLLVLGGALALGLWACQPEGGSTADKQPAGTDSLNADTTLAELEHQTDATADAHPRPQPVAYAKYPKGVQAFIEVLQKAKTEGAGAFNAVVDAKTGFYHMRSGPGVYPIIDHLEAGELLGIDEVMYLVRDMEAAADTFYYNPEHWEDCVNDGPVGFFLFDQKTYSALALGYQLSTEAQDGTVNQDKLNTLKGLQEKVKYQLIVHFRNKGGDMLIVRFLLREENGKLLLTVVDTNDCSA